MKVIVRREEMGYEGKVYKKGDVLEMDDSLAEDMIAGRLVGKWTKPEEPVNRNQNQQPRR